MAGHPPRIVFAGGGTGGHLFPALAVAEEMRRRHVNADVQFIGARRGIESRLVPQAGFPLRVLPLSGLKGSGAAARAVAVGGAALGVLRCLGWMAGARPDVVVGVGGYASGPPVLAARLLRVRTMILEQNHFPGATNRWLASRVDRVCVPSEEARRRLGGVGVVTGNPVRPEFLAVTEPEARDELHLLAFGGSRGARSINRAMVEALPVLASWDLPPRIVHQTGVDAEREVREAYASAYPSDRFEVRAFLDDMPARLQEADLVICRAGAMTVAELAAAGRPAVLVPYPHAADDHQRHNAEALARAGAARVVLDRDLDGDVLAAAVREIEDDPESLRRMGRAARSLAVADATGRIADEIEALLGRGGRDVS